MKNAWHSSCPRLPQTLEPRKDLLRPLPRRSVGLPTALVPAWWLGRKSDHFRRSDTIFSQFSMDISNQIWNYHELSAIKTRKISQKWGEISKIKQCNCDIVWCSLPRARKNFHWPSCRGDGIRMRSKTSSTSQRTEVRTRWLSTNFWPKRGVSKGSWSGCLKLHLSGKVRVDGWCQSPGRCVPGVLVSWGHKDRSGYYSNLEFEDTYKYPLNRFSIMLNRKDSTHLYFQLTLSHSWGEHPWLLKLLHHWSGDILCRSAQWRLIKDLLEA